MTGQAASVRNAHGIAADSRRDGIVAPKRLSRPIPTAPATETLMPTTTGV